MDRLEGMSIFLTAAELGSLSAAGRRLGMPLATVSRKISELEAHLGARLLNRSSRHLNFTEAGQAYAAAARRILDEVREAERMAGGEYSEPKGELSISASLIFGRQHVMPVLTAFLQAHPSISVALALTDRVANLLEEPVDIAIRIGHLPDSGLKALLVGTCQRVICASPAYLAARGVPATPADLAQHDCITYASGMQPENWRFWVGKGDITVPVRSRLVVNTADTATDAALAGLGITNALSYQIADAVQAGQLTLILRDYEPPPVPISLVQQPAPFQPQKRRAFCDFALPRLRARLAQCVV